MALLLNRVVLLFVVHFSFSDWWIALRVSTVITTRHAHRSHLHVLFFEDWQQPTFRHFWLWILVNCHWVGFGVRYQGTLPSQHAWKRGFEKLWQNSVHVVTVKPFLAIKISFTSICERNNSISCKLYALCFNTTARNYAPLQHITTPPQKHYMPLYT